MQQGQCPEPKFLADILNHLPITVIRSICKNSQVRNDFFAMHIVNYRHTRNNSDSLFGHDKASYVTNLSKQLKATTMHILIESLKAPGFFGADGIKAKQCLAKIKNNSSLQPNDIAQSITDMIFSDHQSTRYFQPPFQEKDIERWLLKQYFMFIADFPKRKESEQSEHSDMNKPIFEYGHLRTELRKFELAFAVLSAYKKQLGLSQQSQSNAHELSLERLQIFLIDQLNALDDLPVEDMLAQKMRDLLQNLSKLVQELSVNRITPAGFKTQLKTVLESAQNSDLNQPDSLYQSTISMLIRFCKNLCAVFDIGQYMGYQPMKETYNPIARGLFGRSHFLMTPKRTSLQQEFLNLQDEFTRKTEHFSM
jgi:hypothetical protein